MLIFLIFFFIPLAIICIFLPIWIRQGRTHALTIRKRYDQAMELSPLYQQKLLAERSHQVTLVKLDQEDRRFDHQVQVDLAKLWMEKHYVQAERYIVNTEISSITALPSLKAASQVKVEAGATIQQLPVAPPFSHIAHLMTPEHLILNYIETGPVYGQVDDLLSMALIGKPKRGKTTSLLYYLCILLRAGAEVWVWDPHGEMSELAYGLHYFSDLDDIAASAVELMTELDVRSKLYKQGKQVKHPLVLLVDEIPVIADWEQDMKKQKIEIPASPYRVMKRFTLEARKWRGFVFISGQSLPAHVLPTLTRDNLSSRLVLECSADHARMIGLPKDTIDTLLPLLKGAERGTHIADFSSWSHPELADIPYTTIDDLRAIIDDRGKWGKRESVNDVNAFTGSFTEVTEPLEYIHPTFTRGPQNLEKPPLPIVTGNLVNTVNEPVNDGEDIIQVSPEEEAKILQLAKIQKRMYGRVVRTKIRDALGWNNKDFPKIKQVLDKAGM